MGILVGHELLGYNPWVMGLNLLENEAYGFGVSFGLFPFFEIRNFTSPTMCKNDPLIFLGGKLDNILTN